MHQSRTVLKRKDVMNSAMLGYVYEIVIFTSFWLQKLMSPISPFFLEATSNFPGPFWNSTCPLQSHFPSFHFRKVKVKFPAKVIRKDRHYSAGQPSAWYLYFNQQEEKDENSFWRFCKSLKQLARPDFLQIIGFLPNPLYNRWTTMDYRWSMNHSWPASL